MSRSVATIPGVSCVVCAMCEPRSDKRREGDLCTIYALGAEGIGLSVCERHMNLLEEARREILGALKGPN